MIRISAILSVLVLVACGTASSPTEAPTRSAAVVPTAISQPTQSIVAPTLPPAAPTTRPTNTTVPVPTATSPPPTAVPTVEPTPSPAPHLVITSPTNSATVTTETIDVQGTGAPGAQVEHQSFLAGSEPTTVDASGEWRIRVRLASGENVLTFRQSGAGTGEQELRITYDPPIPTPGPTDTPTPTDTPEPTEEPEPTPTDTPESEPTASLPPVNVTRYVNASAVDPDFTGANFRAEPSLNADLVQEEPIPNGEAILTSENTIIGEGGTPFYRAQYDGRYGFVSARLVSDDAPTPTSDTIRLSGRGQEVTGEFDLPSPISRLSFAHSGESNFIVHAFGPNGEEEFLVNAIGNYEGSRPLFTPDIDGWYLEVEADGRWTIRVAALPVSDEPVLELEGAGDYVSDQFMPEGEFAVPYRFTHRGEDNFAVWLRCMGGEDLAQNEIGRVNNTGVV